MAIDLRAFSKGKEPGNDGAMATTSRGERQKLRGTIELGETAQFGDRLITVRRGRGRRIKITIETIFTPSAVDKMPPSCN